MRDYYEQLYANTLGSLEEVDKFPGTYYISRLNYEQIEDLNRPIISNEIKSIKSLPSQKIPGLDVFTADFYEALIRTNMYYSQTIFERWQKKKYFQTHSTRPALPW